MPSQTLPEGTDTIITGAGSDGRDAATSSGVTTTGSGGASFPGGASSSGGTSSTGLSPASGASSTSIGDEAADTAQSLRDQATAKAAELKGQVGDKARDYVEQGRSRATEALENVSRMIGDAATAVDEKVGAEYGDYARRAQTSIDSFTASVRDKDVDQLFDEIRAFVTRSPGIALGAATLAGFALVRLLRAGVPDTSTAPSSGTTRA